MPTPNSSISVAPTGKAAVISLFVVALGVLSLGAFSQPAEAQIIRVYQNVPAFDDRHIPTLVSLGKTQGDPNFPLPGDDFFIHPVSDLKVGIIPLDTAVVLMPSNGDFGAIIDQNDAAAQANLVAFLEGGGVLIVDMHDFFAGGYIAPDATGTPDFFDTPSPCNDATLARDALGGDGQPGGGDDHPIVKGPDGKEGTEDDLDNSNIDVAGNCNLAFSSLVDSPFDPIDGIELPEDASVLMTANFMDISGQFVPQPILAEYCFKTPNGKGRVILDTILKEFEAQQPTGFGPTDFMTNLFHYALSPAASCQSAVVIVEIDIMPERFGCGKVDKDLPVAILSSAGFDATTVDADSVRFGKEGTEAAEAHTKNGKAKRHEEDLNLDGFTDLMFHFRFGDTGFSCADIPLGDSSADVVGKLTGTTTGGTAFEGADTLTLK